MSETRNTLHTAGWAGSPPRHIAIIMDGNGRWATQRGLPRTAGHKAGAETSVSERFQFSVEKA